jgi:hypothetical protein
LNTNFSAYLHLTHKGIDEVQRRSYKLSLKKRSILIFLDKPVSIEYLLTKTPFPQEEILEEIQLLVHDEFIVLRRDNAPIGNFKTASHEQPANGKFDLVDEAMLSEAKFMLIDFCVDTFNTKSEKMVDEIRASNNINGIRQCLKTIAAATKNKYPDRFEILLSVIDEINQTA